MAAGNPALASERLGSPWNRHRSPPRHSVTREMLETVSGFPSLLGLFHYVAFYMGEQEAWRVPITMRRKGTPSADKGRPWKPGNVSFPSHLFSLLCICSEAGRSWSACLQLRKQMKNWQFLRGGATALLALTDQFSLTPWLYIAETQCHASVELIMNKDWKFKEMEKALLLWVVYFHG